MTYSPWSKICFDAIRFIGMDGRSECGLVAAAVLVEKAGQTKKLCPADYEGGVELVEQLKQGQTLFLEGVDVANSPISVRLPLLGFANAYDGPRNEPQMREALVLSQKELEQKKHNEEARKMRCEGATPLP